MVPYKRAATDKSGVPYYQHGATTYQQLMQLQQPFVPVSCEYPIPDYIHHRPLLNSSTTNTTTTTTSSSATNIATNRNSLNSSSAYDLAYLPSDYNYSYSYNALKHQQKQQLLLQLSNCNNSHTNASASVRNGSSFEKVIDSQQISSCDPVIAVGPNHQHNNNNYTNPVVASLLFPPPPLPQQSPNAELLPLSVSLAATERLQRNNRFHPYRTATVGDSPPSSSSTIIRQPINRVSPHNHKQPQQPFNQSVSFINSTPAAPASNTLPHASPAPNLPPPPPHHGSDSNSSTELPMLNSKPLNHNCQMINWNSRGSSFDSTNTDGKFTNKSLFHSNNHHTATPTKRNTDDANDTTNTTLITAHSPPLSSSGSGPKKPNELNRFYTEADGVDNVGPTSQITDYNNHLINTKINSCDSNNNNSVIMVTTTTLPMSVAPQPMMTTTTTTTLNYSSSLSSHTPSSNRPLGSMTTPVAATPSNSSTPGLPSAAVAYAAAASQSISQSQSLLALAAAVPKGQLVASESASSAVPVTSATTTTVVDGNGEALSPPALNQASSPITAAVSEELNPSDATEEQRGDGQELGSDSNNNSLYSLAGKGGDDNNNISALIEATPPPPAVAPQDEVKVREMSSPHSNHLPRVSHSPAIVYSSSAAAYPTLASYHSAVSAPSHSAGHVTQSYGMPISANAMYAHPSGALLGHSPQHMMKMMSQNYPGKPLNTVSAYPAQYAAHMAQMSKAMMPGVMPSGQAANQQNVAQFAAAYAAQYQQHANAVAASTAQTGVGAHQFTHRYTAPGLNGQTSLLAAAGQQQSVQPTPQLFPGYARAPAPPQHMFVQPPHLMRPQMQGQPTPQFYPGNLFYSGYPQVAAGAAAMGPAGLASPLAAATASSAGVSPSMHAANYQAIQAVQQAQSANSTGTALGLNPYKKMKTS